MRSQTHTPRWTGLPVRRRRLRGAAGPPRHTHTILLLFAVLRAAPLVAQSGTPEAPPFIPTPAAIVELMLDIAEVGEGDVVYDLGSGDGRLVIAAARRGARALGIEYEAPLVDLSRDLAARAAVGDRARFVHGDIFEADVSEADVVMMYLSPEFNLRLRGSLLTSLSPGARIVSHAFHMGDWEPDASRTVGSGAGLTTVHLWIVPADIDGFWIVEPGAGTPPLAIEIRQRYQRLQGQVRVSGRSVPLTGSVRGSSVVWTAGGSEGRPEFEFRGAVEGRRLGGVLSGSTAPGGRPVIAMRPDDPARAPLLNDDS